MIAEMQNFPVGLMTTDDYLRSIVDGIEETMIDDKRSADQWVMNYFRRFKPFADHHMDMLTWAEEIEQGKAHDPFTAIWPRGGGKTALAMAIIIYLLCTKRRSYVLYCSRTQERADERILGLEAVLDSASGLAENYPLFCERSVDRYGRSAGWRRNRLVTSAGALADGIGLEVFMRGVSWESRRPDLIVLDDLDNGTDTRARIAKNIRILTGSLLPCASERATVLAIQTLTINGGIFSKIVDGTAEYLRNTRLSGPIPAIRDMIVERKQNERGIIQTRIASGKPSWPDGQGLEECQRRIDTITYRVFMEEMQHELRDETRALFLQKTIDQNRVDDLPKGGIAAAVVGVDPSGGVAEIGIVVAGIGHDKRCYVLEDATQQAERGVRNWYDMVVRMAVKYNALIVAESNYGGDMVTCGIRDHSERIGEKIRIMKTSSSHGKEIRAHPIAAHYEDGLIAHVGHFTKLEYEMTTWIKGSPDSPNRIDALIFALNQLVFPAGHTSRTELMPPGWN